MTMALAAVNMAAMRLMTFTTDDVWARLEQMGAPPIREPRAMGAVMRQAARNGWCRATSMTRKSARPECHRRPMTVYETRLLG